MANFCDKCGSSVAPGAVFCFSCGAKITDLNVDTPAPSQEMPISPVNVEAPYVNPVPTAGVALNKRKRKPSFFVKLIIIIVLIAAIIGGAIFAILGYAKSFNGIDKAIDDYVEAIYLGNEDALEDMLPSFYRRTVNKDLIYYSGTFKTIFNRRSKGMDKKFGNNISISYTVDDVKYIPFFNYDYYNDTLASYNDDLYLDDIDAIYRVKFTVTVKGDKGSKDYSYNVLGVKSDSEWFLTYSKNPPLLYYDSVFDRLDIDELYY